MGVKLGIDMLEKYSSVFEGKRIGLLTNCTGINSRFESIIELLHNKFNLVKLFAPEHGVRGNLQAGVYFESYTDESTGLPVISLYGSTRRPSAEAIEDIDIFAFDIQNVGSRFYTYLYSMAYIMQASAENGKKCVVFDRPNPMNATVVEGGIVEPGCSSFIGLYPIPTRYGMTIGELALLFNTEYGINCDLTVVPMEGYRRDMYFEETGLQWVLPSPNIPTVDSCFTFNATCIFEGTNVSEGRGTTKPFSFVGAPWLSAEKLAEALNAHNLPGVYFRPHYFTPMPYHPKDCKHAGANCGGVEVHVLDRNTFRPQRTSVAMLYTVRDLSGDNFKFTPPWGKAGRHMLDLNTGSNYVRENLYSLEEVAARYESESAGFAEMKTKYHLY